MFRFGGRLSIEVWIDINGCESMVLLVLKGTGDDCNRGGNFAQEIFSRVKHDGFIFGISILELLSEFL